MLLKLFVHTVDEILVKAFVKKLVSGEAHQNQKIKLVLVVFKN